MPPEYLPPPDDPDDFESLCLELFRELWDDPGVQKNGRRGQSQDGVDVFGKDRGLQVGVQCKQKSGLLRTKVSPAELEAEVEAARRFRPRLARFILATTGPRDAKVQERARQLSKDFEVEVWSWQDIWPALQERPDFLARLIPRYWPTLGGTARPRRGKPVLPQTTDRLFGRDADLALLDKAWADPATHVRTLVAWGGVGKTSLVAHWTAQLAARDYDGADSFEWSFYSQGARETGGASGDAFLVAALEFFGDSALAMSPAAAQEKGARLAQLVATRRTLLVLDGLEPLQYPSGPLEGQLKDPGVAALLKGLANTNPGLCVVTTRERVADLARFRGSTAPEVRLGRLSTKAGMAFLDSLGVHGPKQEMKALVTEVAGHALTLTLLGQYLRRAHDGDVRRRDRVALEKADTTVQGGHAFRVMATYARWLEEGGEEGLRQVALLRLLGLFDRPARIEWIEALRAKPMIPGLTEPLVALDEENWNLTLTALEAHRLMTLGRAGDDPHGALVALDAHPLIREYFARQLRDKAPETWQMAHGRLFDHLRTTTEHRPASLEALQPLYQAVAHGCWAGREQEACAEVYIDRILRGMESGGFYSWRILGAFGANLGAVACFFDRPWSGVSSRLVEAARAWLLNHAAFHLRALGRLREALEPMRAGLEMRIEQKDWTNAASSASNLSELGLTLGEVGSAVDDAGRAVEFADRSGDAFQRMVFRTTLGDALHQAGRHDEAVERFREAETMQAERQPEYPLLYSLRGFQYCDLLLAEAERGAWRLYLGDGLVDGTKSRRDAGGPSFVLVCEDVAGRAGQTLEWAIKARLSVLTVSLDHLTLGRAGLYRGVLEGGGDGVFEGARSEIEEAVAGLRRAGQSDELPKGLLTRAWLRWLLGERDAARVDLDEAWEIAVAGPMPLFMAEIQLYRARLLGDRSALAEARRLIETYGYDRRLGELEDAEGVLGKRASD